jgi:FAD/FMN-containing dehydrogenase/Fe-S oxidoreductase
VDELRDRIHDDLIGLIEGELLLEPLQRAPYASDAGLHEVEPLGAVAPRTEADVVQLVRYAAERSIPLHPRGAGTGRAGGCLGPGLVVDFSRHFRRIVELRPDRVVAQSGVVLDALNARLAPLGRRLGPSPFGAEAHTVGGLIGLDAVGPRSPRYGSMADHVESLRVVLANGEVAVLETVPRPDADEPDPTFRDAIARRLDLLLSFNAEQFASHRSGWAWGRSGYAIEAIRRGQGIDLARAVAGSEGTLALVTEATLRTVPIRPAQAVVVLPFGRLLDAADAAPTCLEFSPSACELYDWRSLSLARDAHPSLREALAEAAEAALIVEFEGDDPAELSRAARSLAARLRRWLVAAPAEVASRDDCDRLVRLREVVNPHVMRLRGPARPVAVVDRLRVRPERLADLLARLQALMRARGIGWTVDAHASIAEVRVRPFLDLASPRGRETAHALAVAIRDAALDLDGTVAATLGPDRHATLMRLQGPHIHAHRELKYAFDPQNLLNPGRLESGDPTQSAVPRFVPGEGQSPAPAWEVSSPSDSLRWPDRPRVEHVAACNNCGLCRTQQPALRMCPAFRASHAEAASPRSQVHLLRDVASGRVDPKLWGSEELKAHADLCLHCHLCESECPAGVDVSALMLEAKAASVSRHGLSPDSWMLSRIDVWSAWASRLPVVYNTLMASRTARWFLERAFGLSRHRTLPRAHRTPFLRRAERQGLTRPKPHEPGPRAAFFVDIFANHFDQELAETVVAVLRHAGVNVFVPRPQRGSGMPALVAGDLDRARDLVLRNLRTLGNAVRDGYTIVCSEPTAALMLRREALRLTDDLDASLVAANTLDVGHYLAGLVERGDLRRPEIPVPLKVGYHQPCHLRALGQGTPGLDLIRTIPDLEAEFIDRGCSGMAGTFGLAADKFRTSLRAGRGLLRRLRDRDLQAGSTECSACRMQMEQGVRKRTLHPIKLLALGYGLNPALLRYLIEPKAGRRLS